MELNIAFFAKVVGDNSTAERFLENADLRKKAMDSVFWNANMNQWLDYWLENKCEVFPGTTCINLPVDEGSSDCPFDAFRRFMFGKTGTRIKMYLLPILFLCG